MKLLVCTHQRHAPNPHSCGNGGGNEIASRLEEAIDQAGLDTLVLRSPCMSMCAQGPNVHLLPTGKTWHQVDRRKIDEIVDFLQGHNQQ